MNDEGLIRHAPAQQIARRLPLEEAGELDIVVSDIVMPRMNGGELMAALSVSHPYVLVVLMSGYASNVRWESGEGAASVSSPASASHTPQVGPGADLPPRHHQRSRVPGSRRAVKFEEELSGTTGRGAARANGRTWV